MGVQKCFWCSIMGVRNNLSSGQGEGTSYFCLGKRGGGGGGGVETMLKSIPN